MTEETDHALVEVIGDGKHSRLYFPEQCSHVLVIERKGAAKEGVEDDSTGPDVHLLGVVLPGEDHLGRGVLRGAAVGPEQLVGAEEVAESEVSKDDVIAGLVGEDVLQLDVAVNNFPTENNRIVRQEDLGFTFRKHTLSGDTRLH